jgi:hypothetical protein
MIAIVPCTTQNMVFIQILEATQTLYIWLLELKVVQLWKLEKY